MTSFWIVTSSDGPDHVCELREQAMEHAAEMAGDFPANAPWNVTEYVPARDLAAAKADAERLDWLHQVNPIVFHEDTVGMGWQLVVNHVWFSGETIRAAIDAAIAGSK